MKRNWSRQSISNRNSLLLQQLPSIDLGKKSTVKRESIDRSTRASPSKFNSIAWSNQKSIDDSASISYFGDNQARDLVQSIILNKIQSQDINQIIDTMRDSQGNISKQQIQYIHETILTKLKLTSGNKQLLSLLKQLLQFPDKLLSDALIRQLYNLQVANIKPQKTSHQRSNSVFLNKFLKNSPAIPSNILYNKGPQQVEKNTEINVSNLDITFNRSNSPSRLQSPSAERNNNRKLSNAQSQRTFVEQPKDEQRENYKKVNKSVFDFLTKRPKAYDKLICDIHYSSSKARDIMNDIVKVTSKVKEDPYSEDQKAKQLRADKLTKLVQTLKLNSENSPSYTKVCLIGQSQDMVLSNRDLDAGISKIELKDKHLFILTNNHKLYQLKHSIIQGKKTFDLQKFSLIEKYKVQNFTNQSDQHLNFTDKYGMLYRYNWKEKEIQRIPNISLMNHQFIQMQSTLEKVVGVNIDYRVKYLHPHNQHYPNLIGYELSIIYYLKRINVKQISCGSRHTLILTIEGKLLSQGNGEYGQLGTEQFYNEFSLPVIPHFFKNLALTEVCAFRETSMVLTIEGLVFTFGCGFEGQIGNGKIENQRIPYCLQKSNLNCTVKKIKANDFTASMITHSNQMYVWGLFQIQEELMVEKKNPHVTEEALYFDWIQSTPLDITSLVIKRSNQPNIFESAFDYEINDNLIVFIQQELQQD